MKDAAVPTKPNIVLILADDLGFSDLGCYGGEIRTPRLDELAEKGARFSQMYNCARCCPSRASLLTGLYPHQAGIGHMVRNLGIDGYQGYLNDRCVTIAEVLRETGYHTYMCGKWHVGGHYTTSRKDMDLSGNRGFPMPMDRGFDRFYGTLAGAGSYYNPHSLMEDGKRLRVEATDYYYTDAISAKAVEMIEKASPQTQPFFLYVAYTAPHWPLHARAEDAAKYRGRYRTGWDVARCGRFEELKGLNLIHPSWLISPRDEDAPPWESVRGKDWEDHRMAVYAAQVERMDAGIGRIIDSLRELSVLEDTIIMFLSDNGGCAELLKEDGDYDFVLPQTVDHRPVNVGNDPSIDPGPPDTFMSYDLPWANVSNSPFRLFKHWVHEGGIATPFIVHWRGKIGPGKVIHSPAHVIDIMATVIEAAGAAYPKEYHNRSVCPLEGESLVQAVKADGWQRSRPIFWEHEGNLAVRDGHWKLVRRFPGAWELYDMESDRTELVDLSRRNQTVVSKLADRYDDWAERCGVVPWEEMSARVKTQG